MTNYIETGIFYGYPKCCIKAFEKDLDIGLLYINRKKREKASKNGFVPCIKHARLINKGKIKIESLIINRKCIIPF
jgi:hypothetical protein